MITASSQIYSQHFALIADRFNDPQKAYDIIEQVRGRAAADLLAAGLTTPSEREENRAGDLSIATKADGGAING